MGKLEKHQGEGERQMRRRGCGSPDSPRKDGSPLRGLATCKAEVTLSDFKLGDGSPERWRTYLPLSIEPGELWALLLGGPGPTFPLFSGPARDAGRMWCGYVGAEAGLWGCTGPPPPGRRKLHRVSVAGPRISHPGTSSSSLGRYSCHSGTNTLTYHGQGQRAQTQRLPEWEPGHLGKAAGGRGLGRGSEQ